MDFILSVLYVLVPLAFARHSFGLKPEYQNKIKIFDEKFSVQFIKLASLKTIDGVDYLGNILGISCAILFCASLISKFALNLELSQNLLFSKALVFSLIGFVSIKWYTKPHKFSLSFLKEMAQLSSLALLMPLIDIFYQIEYTPLAYNFILMHASLIGLPLPEAPHLFIMGAIMSLYMLCCITVMWLITSALMALYFIPVFSISYATLKLCNKLESYWGKNTLNAVLVVLAIVTQFYSWYRD